MTTLNAHLFAFTPDEAACPEVLGRRILTVYVYFAGYGDGHLMALADSAMAAHGCTSALGAAEIARSVRTERRGLSLLNSLEQLRKATRL